MAKPTHPPNNTPPSLTRSRSPSTPASNPSHRPTTPPPISLDLVHETSPTANNPLHTMYASKHVPDFRVRNQAKILHLSGILSDLSICLDVATREQNQAALNALHARIVRAGEGLTSLSEPEKESGEEVALLGQSLESWSFSVDGERDWYVVQHGRKGEDDEGLERERMVRARREYVERLEELHDSEEKHGGAAGIGPEEDGEDDEDGEQSEKFGSQETTLVA